MNTTSVYLHGGRLDGTSRNAPLGPDGQPNERIEFAQQTHDGLWYVEYKRDRQSDTGWHFRATGNEERADEE
ncbi:hypothetical protein GCM10022251_22580 [Phytohabitans flavus]|uniref:Uncharacterized protein n=1 Tax=Phytohabitans flavus TaxID=1076124 RepID=A0A6F8XS37_9ACTN|nr:hypothetical protein [Phytohabitans flavus]BCB76561.1 hypothetical protein Pflav_029710 [Phytohabitans flavus]